jgi:hypothetical protein
LPNPLTVPGNLRHTSYAQSKYVQAASEVAETGKALLELNHNKKKAGLEQAADARVAFDSRKGNREVVKAVVRHAVNNMQLRLDATHGQTSYSDGHDSVAVLKTDPKFVQKSNKMVVEEADRLYREKAAAAATMTDKDIKAGYKERARVAQKARRDEEKKKKAKEMPGTSKS